MLRAVAPFSIVIAAAVAAVAACGRSASPEKDGTETFGCYVGSCVSPGVGDDDDADGGGDDAHADASDAR